MKGRKGKCEASSEVIEAIDGLLGRSRYRDIEMDWEQKKKQVLLL